MLSTISCLMMALAQPAAASTITAVTVYPDKAEVTREAVFQVAPGSPELLLGPLPAALEDRTLRVSARSGGEEVVLGDIEIRKIPAVTVRGPELEEAEAELARLRDKLAAAEDRRARIDKLRALLASLQTASASQFAKEMASTQLRPETWQGAYDFLRENLDELAAERRETEQDRADLQHQIHAASERVAGLQNRRALAHKQLAVTVHVRSDTEVTLIVRYAQSGARWAPSYDAAMDPDTGEVALRMYAWVKQYTGESWNDVELTLATGAPSLGIDLPQLASLVLGPQAVFDGYDFQTDDMRIVSGYRETGFVDYENLPAEYRQRLAAESALRQLGKATAQKPAARKAKDAVQQLARYAQAETVMTFEVPGTLSLDPDGQPRRVAVSSMRLAGKREYLIIPSVKASAYLLARVTAPEDRPLLPGAIQHYVGSTLVGSSAMQPVAPGEEFVMSFGVDDRVKVEKPSLPRTEDAKGRTRIVNYTRRVAITNRTGGDIQLTVKDRVPVAAHDDIRVSLASSTTEGFEVDDDAPGIYTWNLQLSADEKRQVSLAYSLRFPAGMTLSALR